MNAEFCHRLPMHLSSIKVPTHRAGRLPSLDGMRAVAVLMVVFAHAGAGSGWMSNVVIRELHRTFSGYFGVQVFFVISGFIITRLLLLERQSTSQVDLRSFWARRALRLAPPLAAYLSVVFLLSMCGWLRADSGSVWASLFFFRNHVPETDFITSHCWSLSVEEQFYLLWPLAVAFLPMKILKRVAWSGVVAALIMRVLMGVSCWRWLLCNADGLMAGVLASIWVHENAGRTLLRIRKTHVLLHLGFFVGVLTIQRFSVSVAFGDWLYPLRATVIAALTSYWLVRMVSGGGGWLYQMLNWKPVVALGIASYSIYLWQQLFTAPADVWTDGIHSWVGLPVNMLAAVMAGGAAWYLVERPCQALRRRFDMRLGAKAVVATAVPQT